MSADEQTQSEIVVRPVEGGWSVTCEIFAAPLVFFSGRKAEDSARALALVLANLQRTVRVSIYDRANALVGTWQHFADENLIDAAEVRVRDVLAATSDTPRWLRDRAWGPPANEDARWL